MKLDVWNYLLENIRNEKIYFYPNPGNAGDSLIAAAEYIMFKKLGVDFDVIDNNEMIPLGVIVIYGGGGNLVPPYPNARNFLSKIYNTAKKIIVLPHTIRDNDLLLNKFTHDSILIAREKITYEYIKNRGQYEFLLADDMALSLPVPDILKRSGSIGFKWGNFFSIRNLKRGARSFIFFIKNFSNKKQLNSFRTDVESTGRHNFSNNFDVSAKFAADDMLFESCLETAFFVFWFLNKFELVRTDRLHVCIAAALLGKNVEFFDNSYGKNRDVYEFSLRDRFPNVVMMSECC